MPFQSCLNGVLNAIKINIKVNCHSETPLHVRIHVGFVNKLSFVVSSYQYQKLLQGNRQGEVNG